MESSKSMLHRFRNTLKTIYENIETQNQASVKKLEKVYKFYSKMPENALKLSYWEYCGIGDDKKYASLFLMIFKQHDLMASKNYKDVICKDVTYQHIHEDHPARYGGAEYKLGNNFWNCIMDGLTNKEYPDIIGINLDKDGNPYPERIVYILDKEEHFTTELKEKTKDKPNIIVYEY